MNPIEISGDVSLVENAKITVSPGVQIQFTDSTKLTIEGEFETQNQKGKSVSILGDTTSGALGLIEVSGAESTVHLSGCRIDGVDVRVIDRGACSVEGCWVRNSSCAFLFNGARMAEVRRTVVSNSGCAIRSIDTTPIVEGCRFENIRGEAVSIEGQGVELPSPSAVRIRGPKRMVAGKTVTLWVEVLDSEGNLFWPLWEAVGSVSARQAVSGQSVPLTVQTLEFTNGLACLTTSISEIGDIDIEIEVNGISGSHRVESFALEENRTFAIGVLPPGDQIWRPSGGVYHLTGRIVVNPGTRLILEAGTLLMMDPGLEIEVYGDIEIRGTEDNPVYFFPTDSSRPWDQLRIRNTDKSFEINHAYFTGGSDGPKETGEEHTFDGPMLRFRAHDDVEKPKGGIIQGCLFSDAVGKGIFTHDGERYEVRDCLFARLNFGLEMHGDELAIQNSHIIQMHPGTDDPDDDKDGMYLWRPTEDHTVEGCIVTGTGDDGIDAFESAATIRNCLIYGAHDKNITFFKSSGAVDNCLIFGGRYGIFFREVPGENSLSVQQTTVIEESSYGVRIENMKASIDNSILWDNPSSLFHFGVDLTVNHSDIDASLVGVPGTGNLRVPPDFMDPDLKDFRLPPDSPLQTAGADGGPIGWQGFPEPGAFPASPIPRISNCEFIGGGSAAITVHRETSVQIDQTVVDGFERGIRGKVGTLLRGGRNTVVDCGVGLSLDQSEIDWHSSILWDNTVNIEPNQSNVQVRFSDLGPRNSGRLSGEGNISQDPLFLNPEAGNYRLKSNSPCVESGLEGIDMGALPAQRPTGKSTLRLY
ncbi:MAG: right-handed parallel beta-helix repeat-containing protein [Candidatus Omnitrophica bacterium]|nr:right-handed parallel beta-helix repeat-containing protein [Candidatus Omnitrophota bacterium]